MDASRNSVVVGNKTVAESLISTIFLLHGFSFFLLWSHYCKLPQECIERDIPYSQMLSALLGTTGNVILRVECKTC
ncbi:hypothetical protein D915_010059 [Fasciola hepatica]|uniref:Uncharacterized protein n=1 Tax=Fasciola hepatica TaxID=6192 RepID=A0A4E0RAP5_FASHE|nr:hypothetical protein D915_010059 [Fasciola hepatica]